MELSYRVVAASLLEEGCRAGVIPGCTIAGHAHDTEAKNPLTKLVVAREPILPAPDEMVRQPLRAHHSDYERDGHRGDFFVPQQVQKERNRGGDGVPDQ